MNTEKIVFYLLSSASVGFALGLRFARDERQRSERTRALYRIEHQVDSLRQDIGQLSNRLKAGS